MEACLEQMRLANANLQTVFEMAQERLFAEDKALNREKALARIRAKLPDNQKKIEEMTPACHTKRKGKGSVQHLGEAKDAEQLIDEEEEHEPRED